MELLKIFKREYKNLLIIFVIFLLNVFLFKYKMYNLNTDFGREAYFPAIMADGAVLYKDIFNTFICPFSYLFNAILIKLFGHSLNVLFIAGAANAFAITGGIYLLSREFLNKTISMAIALFIIFYSCFYTGLMNYITPYSYAVVYGLCAVVFSLFFYTLYLKHTNTSFLYTAFIFSGIAASCKYEFILYSFILFLIFFLSKPELKKTVLSILFFLVIPFVCVLTLYLQGLTLTDLQNYFEILKRFVHHPYLQKVYATSFFFDIRSFITSLKNFITITAAAGIVFFLYKKSDETKNKIYPVLLTVLSVFLLILCLCCVKFLEFCVYDAVSYLPVLVFILAAVKIKEIVKDRAVLLITMASLAVSAKCFWYFANNFYGRYFLPLLIIALFIIIFRFFCKPEYQKYMQKSLIFIMAVLALSSFRLNLVGLVLKNTVIKTQAGKICARRTDAQIYNNVLHFVNERTKPDETIAVLGAAPLINFLTRRNSVNFYNHFDEAIAGAYGESKIIEAYSKNMPDYFIIFCNTDKNYDFCHTYGQNICKFIKSSYIEELSVKTKGTNDYALIYKNKRVDK